MRCSRYWTVFVLCTVTLLIDLAFAKTQSLPSCALDCFANLVPQSTCASDNQTCICTNVDLNQELNLCVSANCTIREGLTTINSTDTTCGAPIRDKTSLSVIVPAVGIGVIVVLIILRMYTTLFLKSLNIDLDDWATIFLGCCAVPVNVGSILLGNAGLGKDMWTLEFDKIIRVFYLFYIQELLYIICVALVKVCFLLFYLRIFPSDRMRLVIKISCLVTVCYGLTFLFAFAFQCSPVSYNWNGWDGEHKGACVQTNTLVVTAAALNIVLDIWVIALPIPRVMKIQASINTKLQVLFMFSIGFLITGVGIYRAIMLKLFAKSTNPSWDNAPGGYWSVIEIDVGIICLCMPAMRSLLSRLFPAVFGSTKGTSRGHTSSQRKIRTADSGPNISFVHLIEMDNTEHADHMDQADHTDHLETHRDI
ncbi:uncharacterized protein N7511_007657 [Penicillium nucicola]|uniref:uncharacterized protein n=1 Tax=Penicillium nucicola TaxID=1850975 RepID=UPI00254585CF|nr:uncharacterized protein N7511_007657 [Penicillium nucicola]KAJ5753504.1 hypothetical protein N7511_007657 [Penicillium nucicola]